MTPAGKGRLLLESQIDIAASCQQRFHLVQREHTGGVAEGLVRRRVGFDKEAVGAGGDGGAGQDGGQVRAAAGETAHAAGFLGGMGGVHDGGEAEFFHIGEGGHVADELVVAKGGAAFDEGDAVIAGGGDFFDDVFHIPGGHELGLFDLDAFAGGGGGDEEVGLAGEEGGDLDDIEDLAGGSGLLGQVDVGEDGEGEFAADLLEDFEAFLETGTAEAGQAGAIGFIEAGLEDVADLQFIGQFLHKFRDLEA